MSAIRCVEIQTTPGPVVDTLPPLEAGYERFHVDQCGETCAFYRRAGYLASAGDVARALKGERFSMGLCQKLRKFLLTATQVGCDRFVAAGETK